LRLWTKWWHKSINGKCSQSFSKLLFCGLFTYLKVSNLLEKRCFLCLFSSLFTRNHNLFLRHFTCYHLFVQEINLFRGFSNLFCRFLVKFDKNTRKVVVSHPVASKKIAVCRFSKVDFRFLDFRTYLDLWVFMISQGISHIIYIFLKYKIIRFAFINHNFTFTNHKFKQCPN